MVTGFFFELTNGIGDGVSENYLFLNLKANDAIFVKLRCTTIFVHTESFFFCH